MTEPTYSLMMFYQGWENIQRNLVEMIAPLSSEELALSTASHHWSLGRLVTHMVADRAWWFQGWMCAGNPDLDPIVHWDEEGQPVRETAELVAGLEVTWQMISGALQRWTPEDLGYTFSNPAFMPEEEWKIWGDCTRQWIIWHVLEHEIYHTGELSLGLGAYGMRGLYGKA